MPPLTQRRVSIRNCFVTDLPTFRGTMLIGTYAGKAGASAVVSRPFGMNKAASSIWTATTDSLAFDQSYSMGTDGGRQRQSLARQPR